MRFHSSVPSRRCLFVLLAIGGFFALGLAQCHGQDAVAQADAVTEEAGGSKVGGLEDHGYLGSGGCVQCHQGLSRALNSDSFLPLTEPEVWLTDPHSKAFAFIDWDASQDDSELTASQQLSRDICRKLGIAEIRQAQQCLSCHANWVAALDQPPPIYELGVACESCHGPSADWEAKHRTVDHRWRTQSVAHKASLGMVDVRHPVKRAEQCFSCHIGNVEQGKLVTHAMYAAGHPPLPSIEIESFARQMPRHWRYLNEKIADSRAGANATGGDAIPFQFYAEFVKENYAYLQGNGTADTQELAERHNQGAAAVVLGGAVALREAVELARDLARADAQAPWPELASFDCTACHHDLKQSALSEADDRLQRPGRPTFPAWPTALVPLAIFHISSDGADYQRKSSELHRLLAAVQDNFAATPFGVPDQLQQDATKLAQWLTDELITPVAAKPFDEQAVRLACARLAHLGSQGDVDFDSARQIAWALRTIYCNRETKPTGDAQIQSLLRELTEDLLLNLPNGSGELCAPAALGSPSRDLPAKVPVALAGRVGPALAAEVRFDRQQFVATMRELRRLLESR